MCAQIEADASERNKNSQIAAIATKSRKKWMKKKFVDKTMKMLRYDRFELRRINEPLHRNKMKKVNTFFQVFFWQILVSLHHTRMMGEKQKNDRIIFFFLFIWSQVDTSQSSSDSHFWCQFNEFRFFLLFIFWLISKYHSNCQVFQSFYFCFHILFSVFL